MGGGANTGIIIIMQIQNPFGFTQGLLVGPRFRVSGSDLRLGEFAANMFGRCLQRSS